MIAPYKWLCDYVDIDVSPAELGKKLIMTGTQVEGIREPAEAFKDVAVGKIISIKKHPDADKLSVCQVDLGCETLQIVCGASNIFEGALVPAARIGAKLPSGITINKSKLRGVYSYGMLCSGAELGLSSSDYPGADADGILIINEDYSPGTPFSEVLGLSDTVLEIEVGANRPDCLSVIGIARECAAALDKDISLPAVSFRECGGDISDYVKVTVSDPDLCERYCARAVTNVKIGPSPKWLRDRLSSAGVRSINNIVDITNFVMLETGQPMHAFDHADIRGGEIIVRRARENETITTLDGKVRALTSDMLLICDTSGPIGIAGIMGGENSGIKPETKTVIFESARFNQGNTRRASRALGIQTESAMRFSKGVDITGCKVALERALSLVEELGCGDVVSGEIDIVSAALPQRKICVSAPDINKKLGVSLKPEEMASLLRRAFIKTEARGDTLECEIPGFRGDISVMEDIAEEVARMHGYDNIPLTRMTGEIRRGVVPAQEKSLDRIRSLLTGLGYSECVTYSFASASDLDKLALPPDDMRRNMLEIINPLGGEQKYMRTSALPEMLKVIAGNLNRKNAGLMLFETGRVYLPSDSELPDERQYVCIAHYGEEALFELKGTVENLFESFGIRKAKFETGGPVYFHPYRKALIGAGQTVLGEIGEIHPDVCEAYGISGRLSVAVLYLGELLDCADETVRFEPLPKFPPVQRDIALIVDSGVPAGSVLDCAAENAGSYLESVSLFDVYSGAQLGGGKKSLAFSVVLRAKDRTLTDAEANAARDRIVEAAGRLFGAKLRE